MKNNNTISPEKIYAMYYNRSSMEEKQEYEKVDISKIKDDIKKILRGRKDKSNPPKYNYLSISNSDRISKVSKLYKKLAKFIIEILKKQYQGNEDKFKEISDRILNYANNKIRTDKTGKVFIIIGGKNYFGDIQGYENMFVNNKINFKKTFKTIIAELLNLIEKEQPEKGKAFILNSKKNIYKT